MWQHARNILFQRGRRKELTIISKHLTDEGRHARYLAHLANHTYHLHSRVSDIAGLYTQLQQMNLNLDTNPGNPFYDLPSGHHGNIAVATDHAIIAIRGSGEPDDWRNNLRFWQVAYGVGGHVHAGFAAAAQGITRAVQTELQWAPVLYQNKAFWLTGHSSGGSVALLVAQELAARHIDIAGIYTLQTQLLIVTGCNAALRQALTFIPWAIPTQIYGFVDNMPELMHAADLLVTKAGPGTISETLIAGLPMILADYISSQETGNVQFVESNGVGRYVPDTEAIADLVQEWCTPGQPALATMARNAARLARPRAALLITEDLCYLLEHGTAPAPVKAATMTKARSAAVATLTELARMGERNQ